MKHEIINPLGIEPETAESDECARCDAAWEVQYNDENLCYACYNAAVYAAGRPITATIVNPELGAEDAAAYADAAYAAVRSGTAKPDLCAIARIGLKQPWAE